MTLSQICDRLLAGPVHRIEWRDGSSPLLPPVGRAITVGWIFDTDAEDADCAAETVIADAWVEVAPDGLTLHFNAIGEPGGSLRGQKEPLANILRVD